MKRLVIAAGLLLAGCSLFHSDSVVTIEAPARGLPYSSIRMDEGWLKQVIQEHLEKEIGEHIHVIDITFDKKHRVIEVFVIKGPAKGEEKS